MKKLMIAAAIVCAAAMSQAASVNWASSEITTEGITCAKGGNFYENQCVTMYVWEFAAADWNSSYETAGNIWAAVQDGTLNLDTALSKRVDGAFGQARIEGTLAGVKEDDTVYAAVLFLHSDKGIFTKDGADYYMECASAELASDAGVDVGELGNTWGGDGSEWGGSTAATSWQSVPEPTSGLLLLLGVAGLALRRRRA